MEEKMLKEQQANQPIAVKKDNESNAPVAICKLFYC